MLKEYIRYNFTKNPLGCFITIIHWGIINNGIIVLTTEIGNPEASFWFYPFLILLLLDLSAVIPVLILLSPIILIFGVGLYLLLVLFISLFTITFQWFVVGKKVTNFIWQNESEKKILSITSTSN